MTPTDKIYATVLNGHVTMAWSDWREDKTDVEYIRADIHESEMEKLHHLYIEGGGLALLADALSAVDALKAENAEAKGQIEWMDKENNRIKAENNILKTHLTRVIGEHIVPDYCYATGPSTGDDIADLVVCPSCAALDYLASKEKK